MIRNFSEPVLTMSGQLFTHCCMQNTSKKLALLKVGGYSLHLNMKLLKEVFLRKKIFHRMSLSIYTWNKSTHAKLQKQKNEEKNGPLLLLIHLFHPKPPLRLSQPISFFPFLWAPSLSFIESLLPVSSLSCLSVQMTGSPLSPCHHSCHLGSKW